MNKIICDAIDCPSEEVNDGRTGLPDGWFGATTSPGAGNVMRIGRIVDAHIHRHLVFCDKHPLPAVRPEVIAYEKKQLDDASKDFGIGAGYIT